MGNGTEGCFQVARLRARPEGMWLTVLAGRVPCAFLAHFGPVLRHSRWLAGVSNVCLQFLKQSAVLSLLLLRPLSRRGLSRPVALPKKQNG
jgi:hypothetical protein